MSDELLPKKAPKILIVEDEVVNRTVMKVFLNKGIPFPIEILEAVDGVDGLEQAIEHSPDMILVDLEMPALSGEELILALKRRKIETKVIVVSAHVHIPTITEVMREGACDFIGKPFTDSAVDVIRKHLLEGVRLDFYGNTQDLVNRVDRQDALIIEQTQQLEEYKEKEGKLDGASIVQNAALLILGASISVLFKTYEIVSNETALIMFPVLVLVVSRIKWQRLKSFGTKIGDKEGRIEID